MKKHHRFIERITIWILVGIGALLLLFSLVLTSFPHRDLILVLLTGLLALYLLYTLGCWPVADFESIMKAIRQPGSAYFYCTRDEAEMEINNIRVKYRLVKKTLYKRLVSVSLQIDYPPSMKSDESYAAIKKKLKKAIAEEVGCLEQMRCRRSRFYITLSGYFTNDYINVDTFRRFNECARRVIEDELHLDECMQWFKCVDDETGDESFYEFKGVIMQRYVVRNLEEDTWECDYKYGPWDIELSDLDEDSTLITQEEFHAVYQAAWVKLKDNPEMFN